MSSFLAAYFTILILASGVLLYWFLPRSRGRITVPRAYRHNPSLAGLALDLRRSRPRGA